MDLDCLIGVDSDHVIKFRGDRPRELGDPVPISVGVSLIFQAMTEVLFLFQRISVTIQRFNSAKIRLGCPTPDYREPRILNMTTQYIAGVRLFNTSKRASSL